MKKLAMIESRNFYGVLVERRQDFNSAWAVMDLVKDEPEALGMPKTVPPVEDEGAHEPVEEAFENRAFPIAKIKHGVFAEVAVPDEAASTDQRKLHHVHQSCSRVPATHMRQLPAWADALQDEEHQGDHTDQYDWQCLVKKLMRNGGLQW